MVIARNVSSRERRNSPMNRFPIRREKGRIPLCTGIALLAQNRQGLNCHRMDEHGTPIPPPSDGMHVPKGHRGRPVIVVVLNERFTV